MKNPTLIGSPGVSSEANQSRSKDKGNSGVSEVSRALILLEYEEISTPDVGGVGNSHMRVLNLQVYYCQISAGWE